VLFEVLKDDFIRLAAGFSVFGNRKPVAMKSNSFAIRLNMLKMPQPVILEDSFRFAVSQESEQVFRRKKGSSIAYRIGWIQYFSFRQEEINSLKAISAN
jgi:hypothetical protein